MVGRLENYPLELVDSIMRYAIKEKVLSTIALRIPANQPRLFSIFPQIWKRESLMYPESSKDLTITRETP